MRDYVASAPISGEIARFLVDADDAAAEIICHK